MKKIVLCAVALVAASAVSAQTGEITSNRGENWLSQDGDWGLTFDANPFLNYAGNLFNGANSNGIGNGLTWANDNFAIQGKKLVNANTAYRAKLRIGFGSDRQTILVDDVTSTSTPAAQVDDVAKSSYMNIDLGIGLEKRVGSTRIVGVYGGEFGFGVGSSKTSFEYGNALTTTNTNHTNSFEQGAGLTERKNGSTFYVGLRAFAGVEWFVAPKVSLSGEYTWGLALSSTGHGESTVESWDAAANGGNGAVTSTTTVGNPNSPKLNSFGIDNNVTGATIGINFYFQ